MTFDLSEFKRLAGERTKGGWWSDESSSFKFSVKNDTDILSNDSNKNDAEFIAYCGTHADEMIAYIEELEAIRAKEVSIVGKTAMNNSELRKRIEKLEKALEFYADVENWNEWDMELGETARKALEERGE
jgi:hypothetical protein